MPTLILKIRFAALLLLFACLLSACAPRPSSPPDYRQQDFEAEISWKQNDLTLDAVLTVRDAAPQSLLLTAPASMRGLRVVWEAGTPTVEWHGMTTDAGPLSELWQTAALLTVSGTITPVAKTQENDRTLLYATIPSSSELPYELYLDPDSGIPHKIRYGERLLTVRRFTVIS